MAIAAFTATSLPLVLTTGALALLIAPWLIRLPVLALVTLAVSLITGQLLRLPLPGQGGGLLLSDAAVIILIVSAVITTARSTPLTRGAQGGSTQTVTVRYTLLVTLFLLSALAPLIIHAPQYGSTNTTIALAYWLRLAAYLLILPSVLLLTRAHLKLLPILIMVTAGTLTILGYAQLITVPNFTSLAAAGWDPHYLRLTSTWLDPNFAGIAFVLLIVTTSAIATHQHRWRLAGTLISMSLAITLILTQSRSALIAIAAATLIVVPLYIITRRPRPPVVLASLVSLVLLVSLATLIMPQRLTGIVRPDDPTVQLRTAALTRIWHLAEQHTILGVGYNAYQFAAREAGLISDFTIHSRAGADNSFLTLWVTTGLIGVISFTLILSYLAQLLIHRMVHTRSFPAVAALTALIALIINAQFINSLLYAHLLVLIQLIIAWALTASIPLTRFRSRRTGEGTKGVYPEPSRRVSSSLKYQ